MAGPIIDADFAWGSGERRWMSGSYRRNRNRIERLIRKEPKVEHYLLLALLEAQKHDWKRSQAAVEEALLLEPGNREAELLHAQILEGRGDLSAAEAAYRSLCRNHPGFSKAFREYARYLMTHTDSTDLARNLLFMSLELNPKDAVSHTLLAEFYLLSGKPGQAMLHLELADQYGDGHPACRIRCAKLYMEMKRYEEAVRQFRLAMRMAPGNKAIRAQFHKALKEIDEPGTFLFWRRWVI
ncbi:tetratricopeptide repeat protein [Staphylospora marina]|uniref:tetratricopeptide repeat protein n=1 Tax=Staphylospora marina TaxID=2490858 RepID=UPI0013DDB443|nr:tetratricopeptide repeat protein [Staphylospora marina]